MKPTTTHFRFTKLRPRRCGQLGDDPLLLRWLLIGPADRRARDAGKENSDPPFSYYNKRVEIHDSARKHGVADEDIVHA
jgi:hypothetical protein